MRRSPEGVRLEENEYKLIIKVRADHNFDGSIAPLMFKTQYSDTAVRIDKVTDVRRAASTKAGGTGIRYTCLIQGKEWYIFNDRDVWFLELDTPFVPFGADDDGGFTDA